MLPWLAVAAQGSNAAQQGDAVRQRDPVHGSDEVRQRGGFAASGGALRSDVATRTGFSLTMSYDRQGLPVPHWEFAIQPDGTAMYTAKHAAEGLGVDDGPVRFSLSHTGAAKLTAWMAESDGLHPCETKTKNLARMGDKVMVYRPEGGTEARCAFNYTDNKPLSAAAQYLINVSYTLEQGATIERMHRYDRLGLDPVMIQLSAAAKDGKAPELGAIRPALESLVADDAVLERVRAKAGQLLELANQQ